MGGQRTCSKRDCSGFVSASTEKGAEQQEMIQWNRVAHERVLWDEVEVIVPSAWLGTVYNQWLL